MIEQCTEQPLVSIITPTHNTADFVGETIESVLAQDYQHWEMLVVDDCSTDNSVDIVKSYASRDSRIKLLQLTRNHGPAGSRNQALAVAKGRFIAFLDSDDLWLPEKLSLQVAFMLQQQHAFTFTAYQKITEQGHPVGVIGVPPMLHYTDLLKTCYIGCLTAMYDTQVFGKVAMPEIRKSQDYGLWLLLMQKQRQPAAALTEPLARYRLRANSNTANKWKSAGFTWQIYRQVAGLGPLLSAYYFAHYAIRGGLRTYLPGLSRKLGILHSTVS